MRLAVAASAALLNLWIGAAALAADDLSAMEVARGMPDMGKGQWKIDILEGAGGLPRSGSICLESVAQMAQGHMSRQPAAGEAQSRCDSRIIENTAARGVVESSCPEGTVRTTIMRDGERAFLMHAEGTRHGQPVSMRARYAYEGPCQAGDSSVGMGKDSPECQKMRAMGSMDPAAACASAGPHRKMCEDQLRQSLAQMQAMCQ
ncbi:MAG TPA: hypothetical protein VD839_00985 [Burkholderiales bacterium]|jgi:hypothetical protein|nr:hypothetical protein [Burkholderiales bacterium]